MYCEIQINLCDSSPCLNGATCIQPNITSWACQCKCGFSGTRCEQTINECINNPCLNGGTCTKPKPCGFICACPQEPIAYYGALCENRIALYMQPKVCIYSQLETLYFSGSQLARLRFQDAKANIYTSYNTENINNRNVCPPTFTLIGNSCYRVLANTQYDWNQGKSQCLLLNSDLAWFTSTQDVDLVRAWLNSFSTQTEDIWIGGRAEYSNWYWDFNNTFVPYNVLIPNWAPGKPTANSQQNAIILSRANGYLFANEAPEKRQYSILCKRDAYVFDSADTELNLLSSINAIDDNGNPLIGFKFMTNVTQVDDTIQHVYTPSTVTYSTIFGQYPLEYGSLYNGPVYQYTNPFVLSVCNDLTTAQIEQVRANIKSTWMSIRPEFQQCNCFDVFVISAEKYTGINNQINTQITYIPRANQLLIETTSNGPLPTSVQIFNGLQSIGFTQCQARNRRRALLDVNVASSSLDETDLNNLKETVVTSLRAVRPDYITNNRNVGVKIISNSEAIDVHSKLAVTQVYLQVTVDDQLLDFYTQTEFDAQRLIDEVNYQNENKSLIVITSPHIYSRNYFFTIISNSKVDKSDYPLLEKRILAIFISHYKEFEKRNVSVTTTWQEEYIDENRNIVYGLSILISVDNQPVDNLITVDRNIFADLKKIEDNEGLVYKFSLPAARGYLHQLSKALTFYSNILICRRDYAKIETLIQAIVSNYKSAYSNDVMAMLAHQEQYIHKNGYLNKFFLSFYLYHV